MIKCVPKEEQPREKAKKLGIETLSNVELLAILLRTGNKQESVMELSQNIINEINGFQNLTNITYYDLVKIKGIKQVKAITILAAIEMTKRLSNLQVEKHHIKDPKDVFLAVRSKFMFEKQEKVMVLCLNSRLEIIKEKVVFMGSSELSIISSKEIFKEAFISGSSRIILIHNHPSGNPSPSKEDIEITKKIRKMAKELEIDMLDHMIIGENCFYSFTANQVIACKED
ncbi:MAG: RadC family protein [Coprobacillaceae bacterium]